MENFSIIPLCFHSLHSFVLPLPLPSVSSKSLLLLTFHHNHYCAITPLSLLSLLSPPPILPLPHHLCHLQNYPFRYHYAYMDYIYIYNKWNICISKIEIQLSFKSKWWLNKRSGVQFPPIPKTDWCLGLIIKSYHQERMP